MKKLILRILLVLVVFVVLALVAAGFFLDSAVKHGVETFGSKLTKVDIKLQRVSLSPLSGSGSIQGLVVGNPEGFKTPSAIQVGSTSLALQPASILSDKVIIKSIKVQAPEITFETDLKGNNLSKILANLQEASGGEQAPAQPESAKAGKKLEVDDFLITGGKIHVSVTALGGKLATVDLPDIHLTDMGKGQDGITSAELTRRVLQAIEKNAVQAASGSVAADLSKRAEALTKDAAKNASNTAAETITKGIGGLFKKK